MRIVLLLPVLILLTACGSKVNRGNLEQINTGMSQVEVERLLGSAVLCTETLITKTCSWGSENKSITISFVADGAAVISNKGL